MLPVGQVSRDDLLYKSMPLLGLKKLGLMGRCWSTGRASVPCTEALSRCCGLESRPGALCRVSLPLSLVLFPVISSAELTVKQYKGHTNIFKKQKKMV